VRGPTAPAVAIVLFAPGETDGNAALIAAAPDLLEAARAALARLEGLHDPSRETGLLRVAIRKAEVRAPCP
jgi:hypothetical protein